MRGINGVDPEWMEAGEAVGEVGGKTVIKIYSVKKNLFSVNQNKQHNGNLINDTDILKKSEE